ncbi:MAG TPA: hypothetical protein VNI52_13245 [Sphingobacteriaceae bacterium]|nr:hypothetical protein [Sphingobacteriaceae bacterium]
MKNNAKGLIGVVAGAAVLGALMMFKRKDGQTVGNYLLDCTKDFGNNLGTYANKLKDRLMPDVKGPNGEPVYADMYDRNFYEDDNGERTYLDQV